MRSFGRMASGGGFRPARVGSFLAWALEGDGAALRVPSGCWVDGLGRGRREGGERLCAVGER